MFISKKIGNVSSLEKGLTQVNTLIWITFSLIKKRFLNVFSLLNLHCVLLYPTLHLCLYSHAYIQSYISNTKIISIPSCPIVAVIYRASLCSCGWMAFRGCFHLISFCCWLVWCPRFKCWDICGLELLSFMLVFLMKKKKLCLGYAFLPKEQEMFLLTLIWPSGTKFRLWASGIKLPEKLYFMGWQLHACHMKISSAAERKCTITRGNVTSHDAQVIEKKCAFV